MKPAVLAAIEAERAKQDARFGDHRWVPDFLWLAILTEETGEVARALQDRGDLHGELVQVAAVAVAWLEAIDAPRLTVHHRA